MQHMGNLAGVKCEQPVAREMPAAAIISRYGVMKARMISDARIHSDRLLPCGHSCRKPCGGVRQIDDHGSCNNSLRTMFTTSFAHLQSTMSF